FGGSGIVTTRFGTNAAGVARDVTVLQSGEIVAGGTASGDFAVARYKPNGALDPDFDRDGIATTDIGSPDDVAAALALNHDGTIYAAGSRRGDFAVAHYFVSAVNAPRNVRAFEEGYGGGLVVLWDDT